MSNQGLGWHLMARKCASGILKNDRFISCGNDAVSGYGHCQYHLIQKVEYDNQVKPPVRVTYVAPPLGFGSRKLDVKYEPGEFQFEIINRGIDKSLGVF